MLVTIERFSEMTGFSVKAVRHILDKGCIKKYKMPQGKRVLVDTEEFEQWVRESNTKESGQGAAQYRSISDTKGSAVERLSQLSQAQQT